MSDLTALSSLRRQRKVEDKQTEIVDNLKNNEQKQDAPDNGDIVAGQELNAEVNQSSLEQLRQINQKTDNDSITEAVMWAAESVDELNVNAEIIATQLDEQQQTTEKFYDKISGFAEMLRGKVPVDVEIEQESPDRVKEYPAEEKEDPSIPILQKISDDISKLGVKPAADPKPRQQKEPTESNDFELMFNRMSEQIVGAMNTGFGKSISIAEQISKTLFQMSIVAAANMIKIALIVGSMLVALDVLSIHFKYWGEMFKTNFEAFRARLGNFTELFGSMYQSITDMVNFFTQGDYASAFKELGYMILDGVQNLGALFNTGLGKLSAAILRALGQDELANEVEGSTVLTAMNSYGYQPDERERELATAELDRQTKEKAEPMSWVSEKYHKLRGTYDEKQAEIEAARKDTRTPEERFASFENESRIKQVSRMVERNNTSASQDSEYRKVLNSEQARVDSEFESGKITREDYDKLNETLQKTMEVIHERDYQPKDPTKEKEATQVKSIEQGVQKPDTVEGKGTTVNQSNVVNKQSQVFVNHTQTATPAPGAGNFI